MDFKDQRKHKSLRPSQIREAEKMIEDGVPVEVICKVLKISPAQLQHLGDTGNANFK